MISFLNPAILPDECGLSRATSRSEEEEDTFPDTSPRIQSSIPDEKFHASPTMSCQAEENCRKEEITLSSLLSLFIITASYLLLVSILGIVFGISSTGFHEMIHLVSHAWKDSLWEAIHAFMPHWWFPSVHMSISTIASAFIVGFFVWKYMPECSGGGSMSVMVCLHIGAKFPLHVAVSRFFLTALYIGGGNPLGSEAPTLHICAILSCSIYRFAIRQFGEDRFSNHIRPAMIVVGCSCGLSAAFNTPLGGILYALEEFHEEINGLVSPRLLSIWIALGSGSALAITRLIKGNEQFFDVKTEYSFVGVSSWMWLAFPIALVCAFTAHGFVALTLKLREFRYAFFHDAIAMGMGSILVSIVAVIIYQVSDAAGHPTYIWGVSPEELTSMIVEKETWQAAFFTVGRFLICAIAVAFGGSGGVFTPALILGGSIGVLLSAVLNHDIVDDSSATIFAMCGMTGFFAALLRLPLTSTMVAYEMTSHLSTRHNVFLPIGLTSILAFYFADLLSPYSLHHRMIMQDNGGNELEVPSTNEDPRTSKSLIPGADSAMFMPVRRRGRATIFSTPMEGDNARSVASAWGETIDNTSSKPNPRMTQYTGLSSVLSSGRSTLDSR